MYASIATTGFNSTLSNLERSTDGGANWTDVAANLNGDDYLASQGAYDNVIEIDPTNANEVFAAGVLANQGGGAGFNGGGIVESQDGVRHLDRWHDSSGHQHRHVRKRRPAHRLSRAGFRRQRPGRRGQRRRRPRLDANDLTTPNVAWTDLNANLNTIQFQGITLDPTNANLVYGGSQDNGTERYSGSLDWTRIVGDGGITLLDPTDSNRLYQQFEGGLSLQTLTNPAAGSPSFSNISSGIVANNSGTPPAPIVNFLAPYTLDSSGDVLYGSDFVNLSTDHGGSWSQIGTPGTNNFNPGDSAIDSIAVAPGNNAVVYVSAGGNMFVTQNATAAAGSVTWTEIDLPSGRAGGRQSIAVDPSQPGLAYAVVNSFTVGGKHVYMTNDFGNTWTDISNNLPNSPVWSVAIDSEPGDHVLYVGNDLGVYVSTDSGAHWSRFGGNSLPNLQVLTLDVEPALGILAAGTHGEGVFEAKLTTPILVISGDQDFTNEDDIIKLVAATRPIPRSSTFS